MRLIFWKWAHESLEQAWHWVYYHRLIPLYPEPVCRQVTYTYVDSDSESGYYRSY